MVLENLLGLEIVWVDRLNDFLAVDGAKIFYGQQDVDGIHFWIPAHGLLFEKGIKKQDIEIIHSDGLPCFFKSLEGQGDLEFDLLGMCFYLVSRYEEYLDFEADGHGRFPARASLAYRAGFLDQALVNLWAIRLGELLQQKFPTLTIQLQTYRFQPTLDIDMAWAYRNKGVFRNTGAFAKSLFTGRFREMIQRLDVLSQRKEDPFFTFDYLTKVHKKNNVELIYFFLLGNRSAYDKNIDPSNSSFQQLIQNISQAYETGIHPSYLSNGDPKLLFAERQILQRIIGKVVSKSRQHFLKVHLPRTYRRLIEIGIKEEYSMGYASELGFRASIASPFYWYDLKREEVTDLIIHPFQIMDVTLKDYLNADIPSTKTAIKKIINATKAAHGQFISIWHNSSFHELEGWGGWKEVYEFLLEKGSA